MGYSQLITEKNSKTIRILGAKRVWNIYEQTRITSKRERIMFRLGGFENLIKELDAIRDNF